ncbi:MAG: beta-ketoacyl synthase N-terminal-like domain-containing protein [Kiritimatiellae bacterium]|nr:beta-ketoacyl synthase N-terminal-like domain-containing protein [Kiritimatiellia bacterium]
MELSFYLQHAAYAGHDCAWARAFFPERPLLCTPPTYNTRRLDDMSIHALQATLRALAESGTDPSEFSRYGVLTLSHNGPSIYSEEFYGQLLSEENPQMASPMLFTESVLNIAASHIALALKTHAPILALNAGVADGAEIIRQLAILLQARHAERLILCAAEEFSPICTEVLQACSNYPGKTFQGGAVSLLTSRDPLPGHSTLVRLSPVLSPENALPQLARLAEKKTRLLLGSFSDAPQHLDALPTLEPGPALPYMKNEQAFTVLFAAEWAECARRSLENNQRIALIQANTESIQWALFNPA